MDAAFALDDFAKGRKPDRALVLSGSISLDHILPLGMQDILEAARLIATLAEDRALPMRDTDPVRVARLANIVRAASHANRHVYRNPAGSYDKKAKEV